MKSSRFSISCLKRREMFRSLRRFGLKKLKVKIRAKKRGFSRLITNISGFEEDQSSSNPEFFVS